MAADDADQRARLDADHARRLLAMLVSTSGRLAPVIDDWRPAVLEVGAEIVPTHADLFAVDVIDTTTGVPEPVFWRTAHPESAPPAAWIDVVRAGISAGGPSLHPEVSPARTGGPPPQTVFATAAQELGLSSLAVLPVTTRGLTLGTIAVGTVKPRRGLRPSDVEVYQELATRLAMAIERVVLHRGARLATEQAVLNARRLGRAAEAVPTIAASLNLVSIASAAAAQVALVLDVPAALCTIRRPSAAEVLASWPGSMPPRESAQLEDAGRHAEQAGPLTSAGSPATALPLRDATGAAHGFLAVLPPAGRTLTSEEEFVLALLAQATAAAAAHAQLFEQTVASEARLRTAIEASPLAIVELGSDGTLLDSNPAAAALFWPDSTGEHRSISPDAVATLLALRTELAAGVDVVDRQVTFSRAGAPPLVARVSAALVGNRTADDPALFFLLDVTQRLLLEREVQQGRRMEALGRLAGGVAHDFNNLLTIITGYSDILQRKLGADHPQIESVHAIQAASLRASTFTAQLLTISRRRVAQEGAVDVNTVLQELMDVLPRLLTEDVVLTVVREDGEFWVDVESGQLEQVLLNLVVNARNAMPDGGTLTIATAIVGDPAAVCITVCDSGTGMDAATAERCFEPFFSGPGAAEGTGLGLSTVYGIVEQAGGHITFETAPGEGTTFTLTLPAAEPRVPPVQRKPTRTLHAGPAEGRSVLLVEDDPLIRSLAHNILTEAGYAVHSASSAEDAFDVADLLDDGVDLLVTDVVMPGTGGAELATELSDRIEGLRVVFMSGFIDDLHRRRLVRTHPASVFLPKPFGPDELLTAVTAALSFDQGSKR